MPEKIEENLANDDNDREPDERRPFDIAPAVKQIERGGGEEIDEADQQAETWNANHHEQIHATGIIFDGLGGALWRHELGGQNRLAGEVYVGGIGCGCASGDIGAAAVGWDAPFVLTPMVLAA